MLSYLRIAHEMKKACRRYIKVQAELHNIAAGIHSTLASEFPIQRSPGCTSGSPRMLLVLVREFESRRGEILNLFAKKSKRING